jgi:hypothetical protein
VLDNQKLAGLQILVEVLNTNIGELGATFEMAFARTPKRPGKPPKRPKPKS